MAERWQQWMPWHIDRFKGSPAVQAMHPAARSGYMYLLGCEWQTDDCSISADAIDLADMSGLGDELWAIYGQRILRNFKVLENGRLQNEVLFNEWREAKKVFEMRQKAAQRTNKHRWSIGDRSVTDQGPNRSAYTQTGTGTGTTTETTTKAKSKTLARSVPPEDLAGTLPLIDGTDYEVSKAQLADWSEAYPAVNVKQQLLEFKEWCKANPSKRKTRRGVCPAIVRWLGKEQDKGGTISLVSRFAPPPQPKPQILARPGGAA